MGPPAVRAGGLPYSYNFVAQDSGLAAALQGLPRLQAVQVVGLSSDQVTTLKVRRGPWQHWGALVRKDLRLRGYCQVIRLATALFTCEDNYVVLCTVQEHCLRAFEAQLQGSDDWMLAIPGRQPWRR